MLLEQYDEKPPYGWPAHTTHSAIFPEENVGPQGKLGSKGEISLSFPTISQALMDAYRHGNQRGISGVRQQMIA